MATYSVTVVECDHPGCNETFHLVVAGGEYSPRAARAEAQAKSWDYTKHKQDGGIAPDPSSEEETDDECYERERRTEEVADPEADAIADESK